MIVDPEKENYAGIGFDWPPIRVGKGEILMQEGLMQAIGAEIGDEVHIPIDYSSLLGDRALTKLLALMCIEAEGEAFVDFKANEFVLTDERIPLAHIGLDEDIGVMNLNFTIS